MSILRRKFYWADHDDYGAGWNINPQDPLSIPVVGLGIFHDAVEHPELHVYGWSLPDEIRAIGAMIFTRVQSGMISLTGNNTYDGVLGQTLSIIFAEAVFQWGENTPKIPKRWLKFEDDWVDNLIRDTINSAKREFRKEITYFDLEEQPQNNLRECQNFWRYAYAYMRQGYYRVCNGLFGNSGVCTARWICEQIQEKVPETGDYGECLDICINTESGETRIIHDYAGSY
jgi:hypothetical protein